MILSKDPYHALLRRYMRFFGHTKKKLEINTVKQAAPEIPQIITTILAQQKAQLFTLQKNP